MDAEQINLGRYALTSLYVFSRTECDVVLLLSNMVIGVAIVLVLMVSEIWVVWDRFSIVFTAWLENAHQPDDEKKKKENRFCCKTLCKPCRLLWHRSITWWCDDGYRRRVELALMLGLYLPVTKILWCHPAAPGQSRLITSIYTPPPAWPLQFMHVKEELVIQSRSMVDTTNLHFIVHRGATLTIRAPAMRITRDDEVCVQFICR